MTTRHATLALLPLLLAACSAETREPLPEAASYLLHVDAVTLDGEGPGWGPTVPDESVGLGQEIRLDLEVDGGQVVAWLTRPWGSPTEYRAAADRSPLVLEPVGEQVWLQGSHSSGGTSGTLRLERITIDGWVDGDRVAITGGARFEGLEDVWAGDVGWSHEARGDLTARPDDVAPEVRFGRQSPLGALRPWEPVLFHASEPVHRDAILGRIRASGGVVRVETDEPPHRVTRATIYPNGWWSPADALEVTVDAGIADAVGNAGTGADASFPMLVDVAPRAAFDFEDDAGSAVTSWGGEAGDRPEWIECAEGAGCLFLRRPEMGAAGVFARLSSETGFRTVRARVRVLPEPGTYGDWYGDPAQITIAAAEEASTDEIRTNATVSATAIEDLPEPYMGDSGWQTVELDLGREVTGAGVVFHFTDPYGYAHDTTGGSNASAGAPRPPLAPATIVVDDIEVY